MSEPRVAEQSSGALEREVAELRATVRRLEEQLSRTARTTLPSAVIDFAQQGRVVAPTAERDLEATLAADGEVRIVHRGGSTYLQAFDRRRATAGQVVEVELT